MTRPVDHDPTDEVPTGDRAVKWQLCPIGYGCVDFGVTVVDPTDDHGHCPWCQTTESVQTEDAGPDTQAWSCTRCRARWAISPYDDRTYQGARQALNRLRQIHAGQDCPACGQRTEGT